MTTIKIKTSNELTGQKIGQQVHIGTKIGWYAGEELIHTCPSRVFEIPIIVTHEKDCMIKYEVHLDETGGALIPHEVKGQKEIEHYLSLKGASLN